MGDEAVWLDEDWLHGIPWNASLFGAVRVAQGALTGWDHEKARAASSQLFEVFERWTTDGEMPNAGEQTAAGIEDPSARRDGAPPWESAGWDVVDPVDLLQRRLVRDEYQPFIELSAKWNNREETALALLCLHFAAERFDIAATAGLLTMAPPYTNTSPSFLALKAGFQLMLRWLIREYEDPPETRIRAAKAFVEIAAPDIRDGHKYRERQSSSGQRGAKARWGGGAQIIMEAIIDRLAKQKDGLGDPEPPSELWLQVYSALEDKGLRPDEAESGKVITYGDPPVSITKGAFCRRIQRAREGLPR